MRKELDDKLCEKYPDIFADRRADKGVTAMCWGFEHGDGWFKLLDVLCALIDWDIKHNGMPPVTAVQVKEKFGGLRFYINGGDNRTYNYISFAERMSVEICETCGSMDDVTPTRGWIKNLCKGCHDKKNGS